MSDPWFKLSISNLGLPYDWSSMTYCLQYEPIADNLCEYQAFYGNMRLDYHETALAMQGLAALAANFRVWNAPAELAILPRFVWMDRLEEPQVSQGVIGCVVNDEARMLVDERFYLSSCRAAGALVAILDFEKLLHASARAGSDRREDHGLVG